MRVERKRNKVKTTGGMVVEIRLLIPHLRVNFIELPHFITHWDLPDDSEAFASSSGSGCCRGSPGVHTLNSIVRIYQEDSTRVKKNEGIEYTLCMYIYPTQGATR